MTVCLRETRHSYLTTDMTLMPSADDRVPPGDEARTRAHAVTTVLLASSSSVPAPESVPAAAPGPPPPAPPDRPDRGRAPPGAGRPAPPGWCPPARSRHRGACAASGPRPALAHHYFRSCRYETYPCASMVLSCASESWGLGPQLGDHAMSAPHHPRTLRRPDDPRRARAHATAERRRRRAVRQGKRTGGPAHA